MGIQRSLRSFSRLIMAAVAVVTCAELMCVRAGRAGIVIRGSRKHHHLQRSSDNNGATSMPSMYVRPVSRSMSYMSPLLFTKRRFVQQPTATISQARAALPPFGGCCKFHSSSILKMARKRNGGKSKKASMKLVKRNKGKGKACGERIAQTMTSANLNDVLGDVEKESAPEFIATFASEFHAPVMLRECIDALLKKGEWGEMLRARKDRWRKKRSINRAKGKDGHCDNERDYAENGMDDNSSKALQSSPPTPTITSSIKISQDRRLFIDGTLGGGGHSLALLQQLDEGDVLIGCDIDREALVTASARLTEYLSTCKYILDGNDLEDHPVCGWEKERPMFIPVQSNFKNLVSVLSELRHPITGRLLLGNRANRADDSIVDNDNAHDQVEFPCGASGMLLDLGVSSHQIDTSERGFAFMKEGPLDMRMARNSRTNTLTAADICNEFDEATLVDIMRNYGDEPRAKRIASAIVASRSLHTTTDLVHAIDSVTPTFARHKRAGLIATSARVFQALRIVVNEEDSALKEVLEKVAPWALVRTKIHYLSPMECADEVVDDGLLAVLSYHSMEDKMAKRVIRHGAVDLFKGGALERDLFGNVIGDVAVNSNVPFEPLTKPRKASAEEVAVNSRSRSATLRVAIRV